MGVRMVYGSLILALRVGDEGGGGLRVDLSGVLVFQLMISLGTDSISINLLAHSIYTISSISST